MGKDIKSVSRQGCYVLWVYLFAGGISEAMALTVATQYSVTLIISAAFSLPFFYLTQWSLIAFMDLNRSQSYCIAQQNGKKFLPLFSSALMICNIFRLCIVILMLMNIPPFEYDLVLCVFLSLSIIIGSLTSGLVLLYAINVIQKLPFLHRQLSDIEDDESQQASNIQVSRKQ